MTRQWKPVTQGFYDGRIIVKVDLRQERGQRLAEGGPIGLEVGREKLAFCVRGQGFLEASPEFCGISPRRNLAPPGNEFRPQKAARADRPVVDKATLFGPAPVLFRSRAHVRRPFVRRPLVISSRGLNVSGAGCRSR